jgi:tetratricopeptide (TPR) repeat protein
MKTTKKNDRIVFLSVPESLRGQIEQLSSGEFSIDPSIPIPVELPQGADRLDLESLSWEMILSGMIKTVAQDPKAEDASYYRNFVLAVKPDILGEFTQAAILKAKNREYGVALEIYAALQGLFPGAPEVMLNKALVLEGQADAMERTGFGEEAEALNEQAFRAYRDLIDLVPPFPNGLFNAGFFFIKRRNYAKALECFAAYIPVADEKRKLAKAKGIVKEIEGRSLDDETFKEAFDFIRMGKEEEGLERVHDFLERHPEVWNAWFLLGWGLRRLGRYGDAEASFRKALDLGGDNCDTHNELAICLMELDDLKGARSELEKALRTEPENIKVISNLGVLALKTGAIPEAEAFFRTVLEIEPEDQTAEAYLKNLESAG